MLCGCYPRLAYSSHATFSYPRLLSMDTTRRAQKEHCGLTDISITVTILSLVPPLTLAPPTTRGAHNWLSLWCFLLLLTNSSPFYLSPSPSPYPSPSPSPSLLHQTLNLCSASLSPARLSLNALLSPWEPFFQTWPCQCPSFYFLPCLPPPSLFSYATR